MPKGTLGAPGALSQEIGLLIAAELRYRKMRQKDLTAATGITKTMMSDMLNGNKRIVLDDLDRICYALGWTVVEIMERAESKTASRHIGWDVTAL